ncbi:LysR substrate-binding domain-containing protein [Cereibacter sp. SYSU M97828]|nr:LysR substrate-binding domain-containing protein [Cereibacter flavus]
MPEFRHFETFRAVMRTGSFSKAAMMLRTSQPTVSRTIAELQDSVGFKLFIRKGAAIVPTGEAMQLQSAVDRSFAGLDTVMREAELIAGRRTEHLRVLSLPALAWTFLPKVIARFQKTYPTVKVTIEVQRSEAIAGWSSSEYFDVGFSMLPIHRHGVNVETFVRSDGVCLMRSDHPLAAKNLIQLGDLKGADMISSGSFGYGGNQQRLDVLLSEAGVSVAVKAETPITAIKCELVRQGVGVTIIDRFAALNLHLVDLTMRPVHPEIPLEYAVFLPSSSSSQVIAKDFIKVAAALRDETLLAL